MTAARVFCIHGTDKTIVILISRSIFRYFVYYHLMVIRCGKEAKNSSGGKFESPQPNLLFMHIKWPGQMANIPN